MKKCSALFVSVILIGILTGSGLAQNSSDNIPRPEYPRPQFERSSWINLNGVWTYTFDYGKSGKQRGLADSLGFEDKINVPFCPESPLSGVNYKDFIDAMWYHREITIPNDWAENKIILHFGAVDYQIEVFIDGESVGKHWGGTSSFQFDIAPYVKSGQTHNLVIYVIDNLRSGEQSSGKQSKNFNSRGVHYTRTTGIWQTVWMEPVPETGLENCRIIPDLDQESFSIIPQFFSLKQGQKFRVTVLEGTKRISKIELAAGPNIIAQLPIKKPKLWSPKNPFLYDLVFEVIDSSGAVVDKVESYAGLRKIHIEGNRIFLNNEPYYLRLVLDQGFYPDGIWTAPSDEALRKDIELSQNAGFNGARLHQKVFEERFHYWADKMGYLTWGESSSWGIDITSETAARNFLTEWEEIVVRDRNHPSIIVWTPFNETWSGGEHLERLILNTYSLTKNLDPTRPVNDSSGGFHIKTDIWTEHTYEQDPAKLLDLLTPSTDKGVWRRSPKNSIPYGGQPYLVDEYGGIKWIPTSNQQYAEDSWGYGEDPKTLEEFYLRLEALTDVILNLDHIVGFCYTQLTDIEQEQNGVYNY
ncbi:glycoside hydrolase family 2 protein, partial [Acidobacteriota bacterium]